MVLFVRLLTANCYLMDLILLVSHFSLSLHTFFPSTHLYTLRRTFKALYRVLYMFTTSYIVRYRTSRFWKVRNGMCNQRPQIQSIDRSGMRNRCLGVRSDSSVKNPNHCTA
ncbi:hypothetical protein BJ165DRAFT_1490262 [Panaeolus papilionaceus]|nr:hypothetical protein BJ165DRAFT_1490262 [Panaeolus papilionaceus]